MKLIVVSVGTDHHPFDRMIDWIDALTFDGETDVRIQSGTSKASTNWRSQELIPHADLLEMFVAADAVVCHGGPSTVMDVRASGKLPIVLPRNPEHGEHVDGHQMAFAKHLDANSVANVVSTMDEMHAAIHEAIAQPDRYMVEKQNGSLPGVVRFGQVVDSLLDTSTTLGGTNVSIKNHRIQGSEVGE